MTTVEDVVPVAKGTPVHRLYSMNAVFTATIFLSALLLFAVQPMVSKMLLPSYGGAAAVWTTSLLFFQTVLLIGYTYAHFAPRLLGRWHPPVHTLLVLVPLLLLPVTLPLWAVPGENVAVVGWLLLVLLVMVGLPFAVLSTTGPLVQAWYAKLGLPRSADPYFLYAASNVGSLGALLLYPFLIEPVFNVELQAWWWSGGYLVFALLITGCAIIVVQRRRNLARSLNRQSKTTSVVETALPVMTADTDGDGVTASAPVVGNEPPAARVPVTWRRRLRWLLIAALPSSLMQGVTLYITTDVAAVPLLWVLPLGLYLSTFIIAFGVTSHGWVTGAAEWGAAFVPLVAFLALVPLVAPTLVSILLALVFLTIIALAAHGLLAQDRPASVNLTEFFLIVSLGGALGSLFNAVIAPLVFDRILEYPIAIVMVPLLLSAAVNPVSSRIRKFQENQWMRISLLGGGIVVSLMLLSIDLTWAIPFVLSFVSAWILFSPLQFYVRTGALLAVGAAVLSVFAVVTSLDDIERGRTFFGAYSITEAEGRRTLAHGTTVHGFQLLDEEGGSTPVSYYAPTGPLGDVFAVEELATDHVAVIGLGTGGIAAYGQIGERYDFYEIDPEMIRIARDPDQFTYLSDCSCQIETFVGDGRLRLAEQPEGTYDLIVLDAFTSDAIPAHLLTREALVEAADRLAPGGVIMVHTSNRVLSLPPMVGATSAEAGLTGLVRLDENVDEESGEEIDHNAVVSQWVALARTSADLEPLIAPNAPHADQWHPVPNNGPVWTDNYSALFSVLRWN